MDASEKRIHVLLIEDDDVDARAVKKMLGESTDLRMNLTHASSLTAGIQQIKDPSGIDVVLLDLGLPESRGLPTLDKFRSEVTDVPVVVLTSADDQQLGVHAVQHGAQDYLVKGKVDAELMARAIAYAIERHRMQCDMQRLLDELTRSNHELERFAHGVSHDLKEPLRAVSNFCQLLQSKYQGKLDDRADDWLATVTDGAQRMRTLIDDLLSYSSVRTEEKPAEPVDLAVAYEQAVGNLQAAIEETGAVITRDSLPTMMVNQSQFVRLFQNLIGNGIKFRGDLPPKVHVATEQKDGEWLFSVRDNGIGIAAKHANSIFDIFNRLHARDKYPGTGVGLAICKKIVEVHGGSIRVESEPGQGSVFYFNIPIETEQT